MTTRLSASSWEPEPMSGVSMTVASFIPQSDQSPLHARDSGDGAAEAGPGWSSVGERDRQFHQGQLRELAQELVEYRLSLIALMGPIDFRQFPPGGVGKVRWVHHLLHVVPPSGLQQQDPEDL